MLAGRSSLEKRARLYSIARQKAALNRTDKLAKLYCGSAEANLIREAFQIGMLRGGALSMFVDEITSRFRRPGHVSPPQICKARMAAGESADITTATDSKGEGRFIEELRSVSVRTQRPNRHNSAPAEKFHGVSRSLYITFTSDEQLAYCFLSEAEPSPIGLCAKTEPIHPRLLVILTL
jgi:hypothetical protein